MSEAEGFPTEGLVADPLIRLVACSLLESTAVLTDEMVRRVIAGDHVYVQPIALSPTDVRADVEENLGQILRGLAGLEPLDFALARDLARRRAEQGVPVAALLYAYRVCAQVIWDHYQAAGHSLGLAEFDLAQVLDGASRLWSLTNTYCSVISQAYDDTATDRARRSERERMLVLDALLDGRVQDLPSATATARLLDLPERESFVVVVAENRTPGEEGLPQIEQALRLGGFRSTWLLKRERHIGVVVIGSPAGRLDLARSILDDRATGRVGVSPVYLDLSDTSPHVGLADLARCCVPPDRAGVALFDDHPIGTLVVRSPELAGRLVTALLGSVLALEDDERGVLLSTLQTWIDEAGSAARTAERLCCHRNTIRNRMMRIESLTNRSLTDPTALAELCLALTALALDPARQETHP